ncbi:MAG: hypothetical protein GY835_19025 [bacterium]|nr:hypothetical protein [bacterium]
MKISNFIKRLGQAQRHPLMRNVVPLLMMLAVAVTQFACTSFNHSAETRQLDESERALNVESFEQVWRTIRDKHWDAELGGMDWQRVHDDYLPRIKEALTMVDSRQIMGEMIELLGKSHFYIIPAGLYDSREGDGPMDGNTGLSVRVIDMHALVIAVEDDSPAAALGIRPGWELLAIGEEKIDTLIADLAREYRDMLTLESKLSLAIMPRLRGTCGDTFPVTMLDGDGHKVDLDIILTQPRGEQFTFSNLPPEWVWYESERLPGDMGYIAFNVFMDPARLTGNFRKSMAGFNDCRGVIIDLRGNTGGIAGMAPGMAGWFISEKGQYLGTMSYRTSDLKFIVNPRPGVFKGKVAVLIDGLSASTSEFLAGGLQDLGVARVFGQRSAGAALLANMDRLPNGDGFEFAIANYTSAAGSELEGDGITPDEIVIPTRQALLAGGDPILDAALIWLNR